MHEPAFSPLDVERELRRIGVDLKRLTGLAGRGVKPADFVNWLRTVPGGIGHEAFMARLQAPSGAGGPHSRSEEHTSELQSQSNIVCRLLLEKKKKKFKHRDISDAITSNAA